MPSWLMSIALNKLKTITSSPSSGISTARQPGSLLQRRMPGLLPAGCSASGSGGGTFPASSGATAVFLFFAFRLHSRSRVTIHPKAAATQPAPMTYPQKPPSPQSSSQTTTARVSSAQTQYPASHKTPKINFVLCCFMFATTFRLVFVFDIISSLSRYC